jgi:hypothetical protein
LVRKQPALDLIKLHGFLEVLKGDFESTIILLRSPTKFLNVLNDVLGYVSNGEPYWSSRHTAAAMIR